MEELNSTNVLEIWKNATVEQQIENIDRVMELINSKQVLNMWNATKKEVKCQNPNLIIRIIKEKQDNGKMYTVGLWRNTPSEVQQQTIEEVFKLYKSERMIRKIWMETEDSVKECQKKALAEALNYDEKHLKKYEIPEYIPAPPGMLGKKEIDDVVRDLIQLESYVITPYDEEMAQKMMNQEIPITSIPYFFKLISKELPEDYVKMFWNSIEKDIQYLVIDDVMPQIHSEELKMCIWNEFDSETQKRKIKELVKNNNMLIGRQLLSVIDVQTKREILKEMIENNVPNIDGIWDEFPEEIQLEYFQRVIEISSEECREYIWGKSAEQVQRSNFAKMLKEKNDEIFSIVDMMKNAKLPKKEIIGFILEEFEGEKLEKIVLQYGLDAESLEMLKGKISPEVDLEIVIRNASELTVQKLEELLKYFNIVSIKFVDTNDNLGYYQVEPYDVETYKKCVGVIDELLDGIEFEQQSDAPDREKIIFAQVIKRLANHISYDHETVKKQRERTASKEETKICRNLEGGLLNKTCVCAGYAEIVRNVFSCCGIEVRYISGNNINEGETGHAWNQIKLDGIWYNMDLTWDRDRIVEEEVPLFLLKSDEDFLEHAEYDIKSCKREKCTKTVSHQDLRWYLYEKLEIPKPIEEAVRRTRRSGIDNAYNMIVESQELSTQHSTKEEEDWTN